MTITRRLLLSLWLLPALLAATVLPGGPVAAQKSVRANPDCSGSSNVVVNFASGAQWDFCWLVRHNEGLVIYSAYYKAPGGALRLVINRLSLGQVFVPYATGSPRFEDVTSSSYFGDGNMLTLAQAECPGTLLQYSGRNALCREVGSNGYNWKYSSNYRLNERAALWASSQLGQYNYVLRFEFYDDGRIAPRLGMTGRLQISSDCGDQYYTYGWRLSQSCSGGAHRYGRMHSHNVYWRLDFDLDGSGNDAAERMAGVNPVNVPSPQTSCGTLGQCWKVARQFFLKEGSEVYNPSEMRGWRVKDAVITNSDNHAVSYEIDTSTIGGVFRGMNTTETWTQEDFYVTQYDACELYASDNAQIMGGTCPGVGDHLMQFIGNGEETYSKDIVLWYVTHFNHLPRDEDEPNMPIHWVGFDLIPRDWTATNPIP